MKKLIFTCLVAMMAMSAQAQITWNVRAGAGAVLDHDDDDVAFGLTAIFQSTIPISANREWVFSPTLELASDLSKSHQFTLPLFIGYKIKLGKKAFFIPKIGPMVGLELGERQVRFHYSDFTTEFMFGPAAEFSIETKHFVAALDVALSLKTYHEDNDYINWVTQYNSDGSYAGEKPEWAIKTIKYHIGHISLSLGYKF